MFRRKEDEEAVENSSETVAVIDTSAPVAPAAVAAMPVMQQQPVPTFRPVAPQPASASSGVRTVSQPMMATPSSHHTLGARTAANKRVLSVGPDIQLKGEVASCDRLVIEGVVDAMIRDVHTLELAESGALKGTAEVEDAEISGAFEGDLVVRGKLTVHSSGRVRGNVTYGEIEIHRGGQISGNIRTVADVKMQPVNQNMNLQQKPKAA